MRTVILLAALISASTPVGARLARPIAPAAAAATLFGAGVISGPKHDSAPAFAVDGHEVWFSRSDGKHSTILESHLDGGGWSAPSTASFSGHWSDMEPAMSPDGRFMVFVSNRPADGIGAPLDGHFMGKSFPGGGGNLWRVERTADGWSTPVRLPDTVNSDSSTFAPSVAADGSLWFMHPVDGGRHFRLYRAQWRDHHFEAPTPLPFSDGTATDVDPAVAPDEFFVVFGSSRSPARDIDLFIAFRHGTTWGTPQHLGDVVNGAGSDAEARLSPDAHTLYFSSDRRSTVPADRDEVWNNGKYNIWRVDISGVLNAHAVALPAGATSHTACLAPEFHAGDRFDNVFSRTIAYRAAGFDENVRRVSGSASYTVLEGSTTQPRLRIDYHYDGLQQGSGTVEFRDRGATSCFNGKCTPNTDASGLAWNPRLWGAPAASRWPVRCNDAWARYTHTSFCAV